MIIFTFVCDKCGKEFETKKLKNGKQHDYNAVYSTECCDGFNPVDKDYCCKCAVAYKKEYLSKHPNAVFRA
jgi:hypothetical protein